MDKQGLDRSEKKAMEHKQEMHKTSRLSCMIKQATTSKRSKSTRYTGFTERISRINFKRIEKREGREIFKPIMTIVLRQ